MLELPGIDFYGRNAKKRTSERGEWLKLFSEKTGKNIKYLAFRLAGVPTSDLAAFHKQCETYKGPYTKAFFGALKIRKEI